MTVGEARNLYFDQIVDWIGESTMAGNFRFALPG